VGSNPTLSAILIPGAGTIIKKARQVPLVLAGFGHVGKAFCGLLQEKDELLRKHYGLALKLQAVLKSDGGFISDSGITPKGFPDRPGQNTARSPLWKPGQTLEAVLKTVKPGVLVECTPSNVQTGEPGLGHLRAALRGGWHVVTANKGPLAVDFKGLRDLAQANHLVLKYSAATAAALPTIDVGLYSLAGAEIISIEGILNGTTNYILTRMGEGAEYKEALREAQDQGIAEHNPALDVEGWDTAVKLLLIANSVLGLDLTLQDIKVEGITQITSGLLEKAKQEEKTLKLIGRMTQAPGRWKAEVSPMSVESTHPLFGVSRTNKGITFWTDTMGAVTVTGGKSDPRGAAAALLKDIIHIFCIPNATTSFRL
jgi:homoserine dehydrogenase